MRVVGKTRKGGYVVADLAILYFQDGLPPSVIFDMCIKLGVIPSFPHFYSELMANGMKHDRIIHLLNEHVFESYGKEFRDQVIENLTFWIKQSHQDIAPSPTESRISEAPSE